MSVAEIAIENSAANSPLMTVEGGKYQLARANIAAVHRTVWVNFQKEGIHRYPAAENIEGVEFLAHPHRHIFHFRAELTVHHDDRDIEFILLKRELEGLYSGGTMEVDYKSCEMLATELANYLWGKYCTIEKPRAIKVTVSEDGENGSTVTLVPSHINQLVM